MQKLPHCHGCGSEPDCDPDDLERGVMSVDDVIFYANWQAIQCGWCFQYVYVCPACNCDEWSEEKGPVNCTANKVFT